MHVKPCSMNKTGWIQMLCAWSAPEQRCSQASHWQVQTSVVPQAHVFVRSFSATSHRHYWAVLNTLRLTRSRTTPSGRVEGCLWTSRLPNICCGCTPPLHNLLATSLHPCVSVSRFGSAWRSCAYLHQNTCQNHRDLPHNDQQHSYALPGNKCCGAPVHMACISRRCLLFLIEPQPKLRRGSPAQS